MNYCMMPQVWDYDFSSKKYRPGKEFASATNVFVYNECRKWECKN